MAFCTYCESESMEDDFCDICGRDITEDVNKGVENFNDYVETKLECFVKKSIMTKEDIFKSKSDLIKTPLEILPCSTDKEAGNLIYFVKDNSISLKSYIQQNYLDHDDLVNIIIRVYRIIKEINENNLILGSFDLSDFWLRNNNLSTLYLRQCRKFLQTPEDLDDYYFGEIENLGLIDSDGNLDVKSDITLLGKLYVALATDMKFITEDYFHERYIAYNLGLFSDISESSLHTWIDRTINIDVAKRYQSLEECMDDFEYILQSRYANDNQEVKLELNIAAETHVGVGKELKMQERSSEMRNEDSFLVSEKTSEEDNYSKALLLVADGVSTSTIGTGYEASNIVKDVTDKLWNEKFKEIKNSSDVQNFVNEIIKESNKLIWEYAYKKKGEDAKKHVIMATTLSIAIRIDNKLYCASVGDSPMLLFKGNYIIPLNYEDNKGNEELANGCSWERYSQMDGASSLTNFIGGRNCKKEKEELIFPKILEIELVEDEYLLLCSDGLTDYIDSGASLDTKWTIDEKLKEIIYKDSELSVSEIVNELISTANHYGGGDNITVILAKTN